MAEEAPGRGPQGPGRERKAARGACYDGRKERCEPFVWTKDGDAILAKAKRKQTSTRDTMAHNNFIVHKSSYDKRSRARAEIRVARAVHYQPSCSS